MTKVSLGQTERSLKKASMTTLRIYDYRDNVLALDLRDLIDLLAPRSPEACWIVSPVTLVDLRLGRSHDEFMIAGFGQLGDDALEQLAASRSIVSGNTVILKPSSDSPTIAAKFIELLEEVGLPEGVVNFCQRRLVNEVLGPLITELVPNFGREGATPIQRGSSAGLLGRVQVIKLIGHMLSGLSEPPLGPVGRLLRAPGSKVVSPNSSRRPRRGRLRHEPN